MSFIRVRDLAGGKVQFHTVASDDVHVRDGAGEILTGDQTDFIVFETREDAGKYVRAYWQDFVEHESADEVGEMFGVETLVQWALGRPAGRHLCHPRRFPTAATPKEGGGAEPIATEAEVD